MSKEVWGTYIIYCQHNNNVKWGEGEAKTHNQLERMWAMMIHSFIHLRRNYLDWWGGRALILCVVHICSLWTNIPPISSSLSWRISFDGLYGVAYWSGILMLMRCFVSFHHDDCIRSSVSLPFLLLHWISSYYTTVYVIIIIINIIINMRREEEE